MSNDREYFVYIMTNKRNNVLYTGISNEVLRRVHEHKIKFDTKSFTARYNINKLVYIESYDNAADAIIREKQIKNGSRKKKIELIESVNPGWKDLSEDLSDL
ncbi:MAG: GIY-YIG nuclease family protein [Candidatus Marinimicrobia bacterium]|nr:GIY-YIG nuclease family protein [Candidatus Neomarinimicrobiota bacterium]